MGGNCRSLGDGLVLLLGNGAQNPNSKKECTGKPN